MTTFRKLPTIAPNSAMTTTRSQLVPTAVPASCRAVERQPASESFAPNHISMASAIISGVSVTLSTMWTAADW